MEDDLHVLKTRIRADKLAQWVKVLAAQHDNPSSIPRTHTVEQRRVVFSSPHVCHGTHTHTHTQVIF